MTRRNAPTSRRGQDQTDPLDLLFHDRAAMAAVDDSDEVTISVVGATRRRGGAATAD